MEKGKRHLYIFRILGAKVVVFFEKSKILMSFLALFIVFATILLLSNAK